MKEKWKEIYIGLRIQLRLLRLRFLIIRKPDDAKSPEEMLEAIKKELDLT